MNLQSLVYNIYILYSPIETQREASILHNKGLVIGILILMLGVNIGSTFAGDVDVKSISSVGFDGDTLYVGGSGPNNYTAIQDAINDAVDGDTVYVFDDSSPYYEHILIDKSLIVIGEDRETTIIDGNYNFTVVNITANNVTVTGFTIQNCGVVWYDADIKIHSDNTTLSENIIMNKHPETWNQSSGIMLFSANYTCITRNTIIGNSEMGIYIENSKCANITRNLITKNRFGIFTRMLHIRFFDFQAKITKHIISFNNISNNLLEGLYLHENWNNQIICNNFINNGVSPYVDILGPNTFDGNYWGRPRLLPKMIFMGGLLPTFKVDWHPASEPYDIGA